MRMRNYLDRRGSTINCSIARIAPQCAVKLAEIIIYDRSIVSAAGLGQFVMIKCRFHVYLG